MTSLQESTHNQRHSQSQSPGNLQRVVSGDGQVESRLADVSLHPMDRLTGSSSKEFGIKQLDDIWEGGVGGWGQSTDDLLRVWTNISGKRVT